jgi:ACT domain-containing protein
LYDYIKIKNNPVLYQTSLVNFVVNQLYKSISVPIYNKKTRKYKTFYFQVNKFVQRQIITLELALDQSFGFLTYEKFRNFSIVEIQMMI